MTRSVTLAVSLAATLALPALAQDPPRNPLAGADPWAGVWTDAAAGGGLRVTLEPRAGGYRGAVELQGQRYPLAATGAPARLDGTFEVQGSQFGLALTREGDVVVLTTDGATYRLRREAPRNPLGGGGAPAQPAQPTQPTRPASTGGAVVPDDWQRWRHPMGYEMRYPAGWQLQETEYGLLLVPPDLARDAYGQPQEMILMQGVPTQGVTRPDDPRAVQFVENSMRAVFPFLRRTGEVVVREAGGRPVAELTFTGTAPQGKQCQALSLVEILDDQSVLGHLVAEPARFAAREPIVRQIFASCGTAQAERDQRLVGTWSYERYTSSRDTTTSNVTNITFTADGRYGRGGSFSAGFTHRENGDETGRSLAGAEGGQQVGTWVAGSGKLTVRWPDGTTEQWSYELNGPNLLLKGISGEPRLYIRSN